MPLPSCPAGGETPAALKTELDNRDQVEGVGTALGASLGKIAGQRAADAGRAPHSAPRQWVARVSRDLTCTQELRVGSKRQVAVWCVGQ